MYITKWYGHAMQQVYRTRTFSRWMRKTDLTDQALCEAVSEMTQGLVDANLGGGVMKKRVASPGKGKRGGFRTLVATSLADRWFFLYGFSKNERGNITREELRMLREVANVLLGFDARQVAKALATGEIVEMCDDKREA
jgi:hypothetical protein